MFIDNFDLNQKITIKEIILAGNGKGGTAKTTRIIVRDEPCAFWQTGSNKILLADRLHNISDFQVALKPSTAYKASQKAVVEGTTYTMTRPDNVLGKNEIMVIGLNNDKG